MSLPKKFLALRQADARDYRHPWECLCASPCFLSGHEGVCSHISHDGMLTDSGLASEKISRYMVSNLH